MKEEDNLCMRKVGKPLQRLSRELIGERNACLLTAPEVIFGVRADCFNETNCLHLFYHC